MVKIRWKSTNSEQYHSLEENQFQFLFSTILCINRHVHIELRFSEF